MTGHLSSPIEKGKRAKFQARVAICVLAKQVPQP